MLTISSSLHLQFKIRKKIVSLLVSDSPNIIGHLSTESLYSRQDLVQFVLAVLLAVVDGEGGRGCEAPGVVVVSVPLASL